MTAQIFTLEDIFEFGKGKITFIETSTNKELTVRYVYGQNSIYESVKGKIGLQNKGFGLVKVISEIEFIEELNKKNGAYRIK